MCEFSRMYMYVFCMASGAILYCVSPAAFFSIMKTVILLFPVLSHWDKQTPAIHTKITVVVIFCLSIGRTPQPLPVLRYFHIVTI